MQGYLSYLSVAVIEWPDRKQLGETGLVWTCSYSSDVSVHHDREGTAWKGEADLVVRRQSDHVSHLHTGSRG